MSPRPIVEEPPDESVEEYVDPFPQSEYSIAVTPGGSSSLREGETLVVGRCDECPFAARLPTHISRTHLLIEARPNAVMVTDRSSNGTYVGGNRLPARVARELIPPVLLLLGTEDPVEIRIVRKPA